MKKNVLMLWSALFFVAVLTGCSSSKSSISYFDDIRTTDSGTLGNVNYQLRIVPDDILAILVTSESPEAAMHYNLSTSYTPSTSTQGATVMTPSGSPRTYLVSSKGEINFPILGKIHVAGMTPEQLADYLQAKIAEDVPNPIVTVQLQNFHVNVLGEVNRPGVVAASGERFSVLDAIARAGDLSKYAVRDNVLLVRENNGQKEYHHLNLTDSEVFKSPYFYLQQNDMLVVEPNDVLRANATYNTNNAYKVQVTSAIISACSVVASLVIALAVK